MYLKQHLIRGLLLKVSNYGTLSVLPLLSQVVIIRFLNYSLQIVGSGSLWSKRKGLHDDV